MSLPSFLKDITALVIQGRGQAGKILDIPTANLAIENQTLDLPLGVYAGLAILPQANFLAHINYGSSPTFGFAKPVLEAHLIDFQGDLYQQEIRLLVYAKLRDIKKFDSLAELKASLHLEREEVRAKYGFLLTQEIPN